MPGWLELRIGDGRLSLAEHGGERMEAKLNITTNRVVLLELLAAMHNDYTLFGL